MTADHAIVARHFATGEWVRIIVRDGLFFAIEKAHGLDIQQWVAPALWDLQINGRWGDSFSDREVSAGKVAKIVREQRSFGVARLCPTLISAPQADMLRGVRAIASACETDGVVASMVLGIHLEGPWISHGDGYRGAHPREDIHDPDWAEFEQLQEASGRRICLVTLAPERPGAIDLIGRLTEAGVVVALGHTAADGACLRAAVDAGARLSTHLGNGIAAVLVRHPNPIWDQAADDRLYASLIADGHHLDPATFRVLVRSKPGDRLILVSDASPLAGLPPGRYGEWEVETSGRVVVAGTPYLAGAGATLAAGVDRLLEERPLEHAMDAVTTNPARLLGRPTPRIAPGEVADLVVFRHDPSGQCGDRFRLATTCVAGEWFPAECSDLTLLEA